jgi:hypothetical protein
MRWILVIAATVALDVAGAAPARADDTDGDPNAEPCFAAAESAQPLMKQHKLRGARVRLEVCSRDVCPRVARADCRRWLDEVTRATPSIVVVAREHGDGAAGPVEEVRIVEDGVVLATRAGSTPLALDPGAHTLRFERAGWPPIEKRFELAEGENGHVVDVVFETPAPLATSSPSTPSIEDAPSVEMPPSARAPIPWSVFALGGAGVVAAGTGTYFELTGLARRSDLDASCKSSHACSQSEVDAARNTMRIGDVGIGMGVVLLGAATYFVLARPSVAAPRVGVSVAPLPGGAFAGVRGEL